MKIGVLSSDTQSLFRFRMDMMEEFLRNGYEVVALGPGPEDTWIDKFKEEGIEYRQFFVDQNGTNPLKDIKTIKDIYKVIKEEKPDKIFAYQAKTIVYGSIAAKMNGIEEVYSLVAGLGSILRGTGFKNNITKLILRLEYWIACKFNKKVFFHNVDDKNDFINMGLLKDNKAVVVNGSGVNMEKFKPSDLPDNVNFLFIGRLIKDKGILEYLKACEEVKSRYPEIGCLLVGHFDSNPSALKPEELQPYIDAGIIEYAGEQDDVRPYIEESSVHVLPSYHEGTPKAILESMAMGRPIITTDAPGCRETVVEGINGFLVPVKDVSKLSEKMIWMIENKDKLEEMGQESFKICVDKYDVKKVNKVILDTMGL